MIFLIKKAWIANTIVEERIKFEDSSYLIKYLTYL